MSTFGTAIAGTTSTNPLDGGVSLSSSSFFNGGDGSTTPASFAPEGQHDVRITVVVRAASAEQIASERTYSVEARSPSVDGTPVEVVPRQPVPQGWATSGIDAGYGMRIDFASDRIIAEGTYVFSVSQARCSTRLIRGAHPSYEGAVCSGRGRCDRDTGMCACFDGFGGSACSGMVLDA